jgi:hypothetical protein
MKLPCMIAVAAPSRPETPTRSESTDVQLKERRPRHMKPGTPFEVTHFDCVRRSESEANNVLVLGAQALYSRPDEAEEAMS